MHVRYKILFLEINKESTEKYIINYNANNLEKKILNTYGDTITIIQSPTTHFKKIVFKKGLDMNQFIFQQVVEQNAEKCRFQNIAYVGP